MNFVSEMDFVFKTMGYVLKVVYFVLKMMNSVLKNDGFNLVHGEYESRDPGTARGDCDEAGPRDLHLKMMNFVLKMMDFVLKMMRFALKMTDFGAGSHFNTAPELPEAGRLGGSSMFS